MTEEQKEQIRAGVAQLSKQMYDAMIQSYEMVEKDLPSSLTEEQKQEIFTSIFNTSLQTQSQLLQATMADVKDKVKSKDRDMVLQMMAKEVHDARNKG